MSPLEEYNLIILNRQQNPLDCSEYGETHHIIPRSCGGCNEEWNLVRLTPEEHYRCHELLPFIYTKGKAHAKMVFAWNQMCGRVKGVEVDAETYGQLKREYSKVNSESHKGRKYSAETKSKLSESHLGKPSPMKGKHHSEEARARMSKTRRGKPSPKKGKPGHPCSEEARRKISEANKGHPGYFTGHHSEESKRKISEANKGKRRSEETRRKISEARKGRKGHPQSEETKSKMSEARKRYWANKRILNFRGI